MSKNLNIVIVGFGGMGEQHFTLIDDFPNMNIAGIYDISQERIQYAKSLNLFTYDSYQAVLVDSNVDAVLIATPNDLHKDLSIKAMEHGKNVICEKPVTINSSELEEILAIEKKTGKLFMVHQNRRWDEDYLTIKKLVDEESLGNLYRVEQRVYGSRGIPGDWRKYEANGGGMLLDWGVHMLDRLLIMIPEKIVNVYCALSFVLNEEVDDGFKSFIEFESGKTALIEVGTTNLISIPKWYATFQRGTAVIEDWHMNGRVVELKNFDEKDAKPIVAGAGLTKTMAPRMDDSTITKPLDIVRKDHDEFYQNFIDVIRGTAEPIVKNSQVLRVMKLIDTMFLAHEEKRIIHFEK